MIIEVSIAGNVLDELEVIAAINCNSLEQEIISMCKKGVSNHANETDVASS